MAEKKRLLDVWIVESDTVYREVPFAVVTDWLQQGRLLLEDRVRQTGGKTWHAVEKVPVFAPYLPRTEPLAVEDKAEALEPVDLGFEPAVRREEDDQDVDMIPLIDISLVLLIFFMMTALANPDLLSPINTPGAKHQLGTITADSFWIGIDTRSGAGTIEKGPDGLPLPWYSLGTDKKRVHDPSTGADQVIDALEKQLKDRDERVQEYLTKAREKLTPAERSELESYERGEVKVRLRADQTLPIETVKDVARSLQDLEVKLNRQRPQNQPRVQVIVTGEVSEPQAK